MNDNDRARLNMVDVIDNILTINNAEWSVKTVFAALVTIFRNLKTEIEALLLICLASGLLLMLHGTPGDAMGSLASWAHWLSALALTPLVLRHAWRWTILKWRS